MTSFVYDALPGRIVFGLGTSRTALAPELERLGVRRVLLLASERELAQAAALTQPLGAALVGVFSGVQPHVPIAVAEQARQAAREAEADCLLAIGGGSTIGTAKAVALESRLPIVAVPTTYAGSEMTPIYGLTTAARKQTGRSPDVLPRLVLYDPELTLSLPPAISGPSGVNALAHCVEAFYGPGANPVTSLMAEAGIGALAQGLPLVVAQPAGLDGRTQTLYGAYLAGAALAAAGTGLHHKICHVLGGAYNLPHAPMHTVVLPHAVAFLEPGMPAIMGRVAAALGEPTASAATAIVQLIARINGPTALRALGMREEQLGEALALVLEQLPSDGPHSVDEAGLRRILEGAFWGRHPGKGGTAAKRSM